MVAREEQAGAGAAAAVVPATAVVAVAVAAVAAVVWEEVSWVVAAAEAVALVEEGEVVVAPEVAGTAVLPTHAWIDSKAPQPLRMRAGQIWPRSRQAASC